METKQCYTIKCPSCGAGLSHDTRKCPYCDSIVKIEETKEEVKPIPKETNQNVYLDKFTESFNQSLDSFKINWLVFILLLVFCTPAGVIYLIYCIIKSSGTN